MKNKLLEKSKGNKIVPGQASDTLLVIRIAFKSPQTFSFREISPSQLTCSCFIDPVIGKAVVVIICLVWAFWHERKASAPPARTDVATYPIAIVFVNGTSSTTWQDTIKFPSNFSNNLFSKFK